LLTGFPQFCNTAALESPERTTFLPHLNVSAFAENDIVLIATIIHMINEKRADRVSRFPFSELAAELFFIPQA